MENRPPLYTQISECYDAASVFIETDEDQISATDLLSICGCFNQRSYGVKDSNDQCFTDQ